MPCAGEPTRARNGTLAHPLYGDRATLVFVAVSTEAHYPELYDFSLSIDRGFP